jgi:hypothetical protein
MAKLILLSVVLLTIALPMAVAERAGPRRSLRLVWGGMIAFALVWAVLCTWAYPQLVSPD